MKRLWNWIVCAVAAGAVVLSESELFAQTSLSGSSLALNSFSVLASPPAAGTLNGPGYLATYLDVGNSGDGGSLINFTLNSMRGPTGAGVDPHMNIVVADSKFGFTVNSDSATDYGTGNFWLPAGKYVVRTERDTPNNPTASTHTAIVNNLSVGAVTGTAGFDNNNTDANALAAADSYIANFRKGNATVNLIGVAPGTQVQVDLKKHAFNFGANINGISTSILSNTQYTNFFKSHFNTMVPSRMGKWSNQESTRDVVTMSGLDAFVDFAEANNMRVRAHNLIWGNSSSSHEQPSWAVTMLNSTQSAQWTALRAEISERIDYYVGDGPGGFEEQAPRIQELDVYNESWHTGVNTTGSNNYWDRLGQASGIAGIYEEAADAVAAAGANTKLYVNEYNVLQENMQWDNYSNEYRQHIELIQNADGDPNDGPIGGIGMQYWAVSGHSATYMQQVLQNMSVTGQQLTLTEHGVQGSVANNSAESIQIVTETLRMIFGTPNAKTHMIWGFWEGARDANLQGGFSLVDANWNITNGGKAYEDLRGIQDWDGDPTNGWTTELTATVNPDGTINFNGFYGDYDLVINGQTYHLSLGKGMSLYTLLVNPVLGDFSLDGKFTNVDIQSMLNALRDLNAYKSLYGLTDAQLLAIGNFNGDAAVTLADLQPMLESLASGASPGSAVPEPSSAVMAGFFLLVLLHRLQCRHKYGQRYNA